jgi:hypothetical protein
VTKDRDKELDEVEKELLGVKPAAGGQPFIERPEKLDLRRGSLCWMDGSRVCGADCVAFNPEELDEQGQATDSPNKCLVLTYMGQQGAAALSIIAINRTAAKKAQDDRRAAAGGTPPVPMVGGKKDGT